MVCVLPFDHMGDASDGEFFASGIHDDLLTRLAKIQGLRVISRTSVMAYAGTTRSIPEIGRELRADAILEGGIRIVGEQIRINAQLIDARSDEHIWAETYDRSLTASNIFEVQSEIARSIASALQAVLTEQDNTELALIPTNNMAAYRAFHEIMRWSESVTLAANSDNKQRYLEGLRRAFELDPGYTRPMLEYLAALAREVYFSKDQSVLPEIEQLIERIGEVAPGSADYYAAQSFYLYYVMRDFDRAEVLIKEAQKRAPSDIRLVQIQSFIQRRKGDFAGWLESSRLAWSLDPQNLGLRTTLIGRLMGMHRYDEAREELRGAERLTDNEKIFQAALALADHHEPERYARELGQILGKEYRHYRMLEYYYEAQLAARDYTGAEQTMERMIEPLRSWHPDDGPARRIPMELGLKYQHFTITGQTDKAAAVMSQIKGAMELQGLTPDAYPSHIPRDDLPIFAVDRGDFAEVEAFFSAHWRDPDRDRAEWLNRRYDCQILGFIGSATEAVACLRNTFENPGSAMPFLEPLLPAYDPVRNSAAFQALQAELAREGWIDPAS
jgi:TolB-like protein